MNIFPLTKKDFILLRRSAKYAKPYIFKLIQAFLGILIGIGLELLLPLLWGRIVMGLFEKNMHDVGLYLVFILAAYSIQTGVGFYKNYLFSIINNNIIYDLKKDMFKRILNMTVKAFDETRVGEFISRMEGDAGSLASVITNQLLGTLTDILRIFIIGATIFAISIPLSLIVIITFPISTLIFYKFGKILRAESKDMKEINDTYFSVMQESLSGIREIKSLGLKCNKLEKYLSIGRKLKDKTIRIGVIGAFQGVLSQGVNYFQQLGVLAVGGYLIFKNLTKMDIFIAFTSYSQQFSSSLMSITRLNSSIQQVMVSIERIFELLDSINYTQESFGDKRIEYVNGDIKYNNVIFQYNENALVLEDISFHISPNKKIAIVGLSGSGKTTIFNLLLRFYNPVSGNILLDDIDIREFDEDSLRRAISIVRQEPFLFHASIKDNLLLVNPSASMKEIEEACSEAYIHNFIISLPHGYDTIIGENSVNFSTGQKQRIAIARAMLKKSRIILFDEATSALDNESQYCIKKAVDRLAIDHTVVIIAHRLLTIIEADEIIVIDGGKIAGTGKHDILIHKNEIYKRLYETELNILMKGQEMII